MKHHPRSQAGSRETDKAFSRATSDTFTTGSVFKGQIASSLRDPLRDRRTQALTKSLPKELRVTVSSLGAACFKRLWAFTLNARFAICQVCLFSCLFSPGAYRANLIWRLLPLWALTSKPLQCFRSTIRSGSCRGNEGCFHGSFKPPRHKYID